MKKYFDQNGEWHWFTGGLFVSLLAMVTYVLFEAMNYKNYPFGIKAGYGFIATIFNYPFSSLSANPVIRKFSTAPAAFIEFFMLIRIAVGGYTAAKSHHNYAPESISAVWEKYHGEQLKLGTSFVERELLSEHLFFVTGITTEKLLYPRTEGKK